MTTIYSTAGQPAPRSVSGGFFRVLGSWVNGIVTYLGAPRGHQNAERTGRSCAARHRHRAQPDRIEVRGVVDRQFDAQYRTDAVLALDP